MTGSLLQNRRVHIIWDWNGTLLDDSDLTARITIASLAMLGRDGLAVEDIRAHYRRPLSAAFADLLNRPVTGADLALIHQRYRQSYTPAMLALELVAGARDAIALVASSETQSILSLAPDDELNTLVRHQGIASSFRLVEGSASGIDHKAEMLHNHVGKLGCDLSDVCLIGDTIDDFESARRLGVDVVLLATGMQTHASLKTTGAPVADTIVNAARIALGQRT